MFILDPEQSVKRVFFFLQLIGSQEFPVVLVKDQETSDKKAPCWVHSFVEDLPKQGNEPVLVFKSRKTELPYHWVLRDVVFSQYFGKIPEGFRVIRKDGSWTPASFKLVPVSLNLATQPPALKLQNKFPE